MTITSPNDPRFAAAVRGYAFGRKVGRSYRANEENYDQVEECGHEFTRRHIIDGRGICRHCGCLEAE